MNQERSRSRENPNWHRKNIPKARQNNQLSLIKLLEAAQYSEQSSNSHQSTPLHAITDISSSKTHPTTYHLRTVI